MLDLYVADVESPDLHCESGYGGINNLGWMVWQIIAEGQKLPLKKMMTRKQDGFYSCGRKRISAREESKMN